MREVEFPRGHARNPMTDDEVNEKYRSLARCRLSDEKAEALLQKVWRLESEDPREVMAATVV